MDGAADTTLDSPSGVNHCGMIQIQFHKRPIGELILGSFEERLCPLDYRYRKLRNQVNNRLTRHLGCDYAEQDNALLQRVRGEIGQFLAGERRAFDLPLPMLGSEFQKSVWRSPMTVGYGETTSYLELAERVGNPRAVRAVASANGANAISIVIPCHRIIGSRGEMTGYGGGIAVKRRQLNLEQPDPNLALF